jgi:hypothetical protein
LVEADEEVASVRVKHGNSNVQSPAKPHGSALRRSAARFWPPRAARPGARARETDSAECTHPSSTSVVR